MIESIRKDLRDALSGRRACRGKTKPLVRLLREVYTEQARDCIGMLRMMKGGSRG